MALEEIGQPLRNLFPVGEVGVVEVRFTNNDAIPSGQFLTFSVSLFERGNDEGDLSQSEVGGMNANDFPGGSQTSEDLRFSLGGLRCVGACSLAPVVMVNDRVYGNVTTKMVLDIIDDCE